MAVKLLPVKGTSARKEVPLRNGRMVIGRQKGCAVRIPSALVSRSHCALVCEGNRVRVKDLGSSNGTFVNGAKISEKELATGDRLRVGPITFLVQIDAAKTRPTEADDDGFVREEPTHAIVIDDDAEGAEAAFVMADDGEAADAVGDFVQAEIVERPDDVPEFVAADEAKPDAAALFVTDDADSESTADYKFNVPERAATSLPIEAASSVAPVAVYRPRARGAGGRGTLASRMSRLGARLIDVILLMVAGVLGIFVIGFPVGFLLAAILRDPERGGFIGGFLGSTLGPLAGMLGISIYQWIQLSRCGQTIGKKLLHIRIVMDRDGSNPGFVYGVLLRGWLNSILAWIPLYGLLDSLFIFNSEQRCIHDYIAGTKVVAD